MRRSEYISQDLKKIRAQIIERYGKRGRAMIEDARQCVEYELGDREYGQIEFTQKFIAELKRKL